MKRFWHLCPKFKSIIIGTALPRERWPKRPLALKNDCAVLRRMFVTFLYKAGRMKFLCQVLFARKNSIM